MDFTIDLLAPPLTRGDGRPRRAVLAIEGLLPAQKITERLTQEGPVPIEDLDALLAAEATRGRIPVIGAPDLAFSAHGQEAIISPGGVPLARVLLRVEETGPLLAAAEPLLAALGEVLQAWVGEVVPSTALDMGTQFKWDHIPSPRPAHGLPWLKPAQKLAHPSIPAALGWINYWSKETVARLGFPDPGRDGELLLRSRQQPSGAWLVRLTDEPLELARPDHLAAVKAAYDRFPVIGGRDV